MNWQTEPPTTDVLYAILHKGDELYLGNWEIDEVTKVSEFYVDPEGHMLQFEDGDKWVEITLAQR